MFPPDAAILPQRETIMIRSAPALLASVLLAATTGGALAQQEAATAKMIDTGNKPVGTVTLEATRSGYVRVIVEMAGLPPGPHGFHIHEKGACDPADGFKSAGGHFAAGKEHGVLSENGPHPGDFPNVHADAQGVVKAEFFTDRISIGGDTNPVMDDDGSAFVLHSGIDDYSSQPSGDAGERLACGVIEQPG